MTTTAEVHDATVALDILAATHSFQPITDCIFLADKGYDVKNIYNQVKELYNGECIIPLNKRNTKIRNFFLKGIPFAKQGLPCGRMVSFRLWSYPSKVLLSSKIK